MVVNLPFLASWHSTLYVTPAAPAIASPTEPNVFGLWLLSFDNLGADGPCYHAYSQVEMSCYLLIV